MTRKRSSSDPSGRFVLGAGAVLLVLAGTSYGASFLALGQWAIAVALAIAVVKAGIVVGVFMEAARRSASFLLALCSALVLLVRFVGGAPLPRWPYAVPPIVGALLWPVVTRAIQSWQRPQASKSAL